jgi:acylglycerol lipase
MKHEGGFFKSIRDTSIFWQKWVPESEPLAVLLIVHGYDDHSGRYMNIVNRFVTKGIAIYGLDQIGHGKSEGTRGYVRKFEDFTETLQIFVRLVRNNQVGKPIFILGYSMGGLITSIYLIDNQKEFAGAIIISPAIEIPETNQFKIFLFKILSAILPKAGFMSFEDEDISRDQDVVEDYKNDPLAYRGKMTVRLAEGCLDSTIRLSKEGNRITLPVLLLQGSADRMVNPKNSQMLFNLIQSKDKQLKLYEGLYHELFNEPEREIVFTDMEDWLNRQIGRL